MSEKQYEKVLRLLKVKPQTTMELVAQFIPAPQKAIQILREKGYSIYTEDIKGRKEKLYRLVEQNLQRSLF